jgi:hypothetical protein
VHLTGPLFIYAATVLKFIGAPRFLPEKQLSQVLERRSGISCDSSQPFSEIDALYRNILCSATTSEPSKSIADARLCRRVGNLLRTVILLEESVSIRTLAHLLNVSGGVHEVDNDVRALASVLLITSTSGSDRFSETVSTFHPSFRDFLVDPQRCSDEDFLVKPMEHQHQLLSNCLRLLNTNLRYDVCGIQNLGRANAEIPDLPERLAKSVPEAVRYACLFWPVHLIAGGFLADSASAVLLEFCAHHLLHWLEALSLIEELSSAGKHLPRVTAWCQVSNLPVRQQSLMNVHRII